jgi:hypothetical protein
MAYTKFEQTYVDAYLNNMYPDVEEEQPQDAMLASAPTAEPTGQVTVSGFKPQQVRTDVQPELGVARPIPQNKAQEALGYIGELLTKAGVQLDKVGIDIPVLGRISLKDLTVGESGKVLEDMALGFYPVEGAGGFISGTTRIKPDPALELLNIAPIAGAAAKAGGKAVIKGATKAVQATKGMPVGMSTQMVGEGVSELGFYSAAKEAVDAIQQPKGTGDQFLKQIEKTPGVKPDEIKWTGLDDFLKSKKTVTKAEVQEYLDKNQVEVKEVQLGSGQNQYPYRTADEWQGAIDRAERAGNYDESERLTNAWEVFEGFGVPDEALGIPNQTKFSKYTLPGGENYREILLTLPGSMQKFDSEKVSISRNRRSATQGTYKITYDGKQIGEFSDNFSVENNYAGLSDEEIMKTAQQLFEKGNPYSGIDAMSGGFKSTHFDQPNILAHLRVNDRVDADGKKVLFVEEVQSDWHQTGRKRGYKNLDVEKQILDIEEQMSNLANIRDPVTNQIVNEQEFSALWRKKDELLKQMGTVPDAPFKTTWHELALKRAIQLASEGGYDRIAFTTGKTQAERYDLSKQIGQINARPTPDGKISLEALTPDMGEQVIQRVVMADELDDIVGKEIAEKIRTQIEYPKSFDDRGKSVELSGLDLKVGGEGMKGFYDTILPKFLDKYAKKWDAKTSQMNMFISPRDGSVQIQYIDVTPKMKESVLTKGQPLFAVGGAGAAMQQEDNK